jgi:hypothetical protein
LAARTKACDRFCLQRDCFETSMIGTRNDEERFIRARSERKILSLIETQNF